MSDISLDRVVQDIRAALDELTAIRHLLQEHLPGIHRELVVARDERATERKEREAMGASEI